MDIFFLLLGIPIGALGSFGVWWWIAHKMVPTICFSYDLSELPTDETESGKKFRFKFMNTGHRAIIDVEIFARFHVKGVRKQLPNNVNIVTLVTSTRRIPVIKPNSAAKMISIQPYNNEEFERNPYPLEIQEKAKDNSLTISDLLSLHDEAYVQIAVFGWDEYSGSRKVFESEKYYSKNIKRGPFARKGLEVVENNSA